MKYLRPASEGLKRLVKQRLPVGAQRALRRELARARRPFRAARRTGRPRIDADRLAEDLLRGGISAGETLMVHSSLSRLGNVVGGAEAATGALLAVVGQSGTLLMPAFGDADAVFRDASRGRRVDLRTEPSLTGRLTEVFRTTPGVRRSSHPFSSVCASGDRAAYVVGGHADDDRIAHSRSPLGRLLEVEGKILGLGVDLGPVSFYHVVEDTWAGFPFDPYGAPQTLSYVDEDGKVVMRAIRRYKPELRRLRIDHVEARWIRARITDHMLRRGILSRFEVGEATAWIMEAPALYEELKHLVAEGVTIYSKAGGPRR